MLPLKIVVVDYGMGNIHSMLKALRLFASHVIYSADAAMIATADGLVLPGDGAFGSAMQNVSGRIREALLVAIERGQPLLGVCIGFQILFQDSDEFLDIPMIGFREQQGKSSHRKPIEGKPIERRPIEGLNLLPGKIRRFQFSDGRRIPHIGWNRLLYQNRDDLSGSNPGKADQNRGAPDEGRLKRGDYMYFIHSCRAVEVPEEYVGAYCQYGEELFPAIVRKENITATQFHPEKSAWPGLRLIERWVKGIPDRQLSGG